MVTNTGATPCPSGIRSLGEPKLIQVETEHDYMPVRVHLKPYQSSLNGPVRNFNALLKNQRQLKNERSPSKRLKSYRTEGQWRQVLAVLDTWRIDDEWWRKQPVSRMYHRVILEGGTMVSLFKDLASGDWYSQRV